MPEPLKVGDRIVLCRRGSHPGVITEIRKPMAKVRIFGVKRHATKSCLMAELKPA